MKHDPESYVDGRFLVACGRIYSLSQDVNLAGNKVVNLPHNLTLKKGLIMRDRPTLTSLPEGLSIGGDFDLTDCISLTGLPSGLKVGADLILIGCESLKSLPEGLNVKASVCLFRCGSFTHIPASLAVGEDLYLPVGFDPANIPEGLNIGGCVYIGQEQFDLNAKREQVNQIRREVTVVLESLAATGNDAQAPKVLFSLMYSQGIIKDAIEKGLIKSDKVDLSLGIEALAKDMDMESAGTEYKEPGE